MSAYETLKEAKNKAMDNALLYTSNNQVKAAKLLNISRSTMNTYCLKKGKKHKKGGE